MKILTETVNNGAGARIYASFNDGGHIRLECIGNYDEVRHRYNQMACLIGAVAMERLLPLSPAHSRAAPPGSWVCRIEGQPLGTPGELFSLAAADTNLAGADRVGFNTWHGNWPHGMFSQLSGYKLMSNCTAELAGLFYGFQFKATVQVGCSQDSSAAKRTREAIVRAKKNGYTVHNEADLLRFLDTLEKARFLHFFHQVNLD